MSDMMNPWSVAYLVYAVGAIAGGYWVHRSSRSSPPARYMVYSLLILGGGCMVIAGGYMFAAPEAALTIRSIAWSITVLAVFPLQVASVRAKWRASA